MDLIANAKNCYGVAAHPIIQFVAPNRAFPIAAVHTQLGYREKPIDKFAKKLLRELNYRYLQLEWIELLVGPHKQYHGGT